MKKIFLLTAVLFCSLAQAQTGAMGVHRPDSILSRPLFVFFGESNSVGYATNSSALPGELGLRPGIKIFNNTTLLFETLNIGVNHQQNAGEDLTQHGWELGIANIIDSVGKLPTTCYLVKVGRNGARISQWNTGGAYYNTLIAKVDSAKAILTALNGGRAPRIFFFYSQGINDIIASTNPAVWKASTKTLFADVRTRYGPAPIYITYLPPFYGLLNPVITEIAGEVKYLYPIQTGDLVNGLHWDYTGMKVIATRMIYTLKAHYIF